MEFPRSGLHAHYSPDGWDTAAGVWRDESGHGRDSEPVGGVGEVRLESGAGNGSRASIFFVAGPATAFVRFPLRTVPVHFTVCSVARFAGAPLSAGAGAVVGCEDLAWYHGHYGGAAGRNLYVAAVTPADTTVDDRLDWLVMCGQNAPPAESVHLANGRDVGLGSGATGTGNCRLTINLFAAASQRTAFAVHGISVWSRHLSYDEMRAASETYLEHLRNNSGAKVRAGVRGGSMAADAVLAG